MKLIHREGKLTSEHTTVKVIFLFWNCKRKFKLYIDVSIPYNIKMLTNTKMQLNSPCKLTEVIVNDVKILQLTVLVRSYSAFNQHLRLAAISFLSCNPNPSRCNMTGILLLTFKSSQKSIRPGLIITINDQC